MPKNLSVLLVGLSIILFFVCLTLTAFRTSSNNDYPAWFVFVFFGPISLFLLYPTWLANVFLLLSWTEHSRNLSKCLTYSLVALILALSFLLYKKVPITDTGSETFSVASGYWVWILSIALQVLAAAINLTHSSNGTQ
jgi:phosphatidylserine synthase